MTGKFEYYNCIRFYFMPFNLIISSNILWDSLNSSGHESFPVFNAM